MIQELGVYLLFALALFYLGWRVRNMLHKRQCGGGCASCGTLDLKAIEEKILKDQKH